ncbi:MAG TPA: TAXI family TRAP transporter solute-binding subunit [Ideonella sp.]|nr:TAXI family TRAP transporter solute-binding subunit [Ideonella sp.]
MTPAPSTVAFERHPREHEALLLAGLLRSSRLTLMCGAAGVGKTTLLETGLMPLLRRRADDRAAAPPARAVGADPARVVIPFPDRRQRLAMDSPRGELALRFDEWHSDPLPRLRRRLQTALAGRVAVQAGPAAGTLADEIRRTSRAGGLRWLILLDGFERYLEAPPLRTDIERFAEQFVQAVNDPAVPANFLLAMRADARPLLERFRGRLQGLDRNWLNLTALASEAPSPGHPPAVRRPQLLAVATAERAGVGPGHDAAALPVAPAQALTGVAAVAAPAPAPAAEELPATLTAPAEPAAPEVVQAPVLEAPASSDSPAAQPLQVRELAEPLALPLQLPSEEPLPARDQPPQPARRRWALWSALPVLGAAAVLAWWSLSRQPAAPPPPERAIAAAPQPAAPPPPPAWRVQTGTEQRTDARIAGELMRGLPAGLQGPALQIVHYDALQAARRDPAAALRIVSPLFPEEIHLVVRADSPLNFIHQIRHSAINVGPGVAGGTPTGALLYERLFGTPLPATQARSLSWPGALAALAAGTTDVAVLVDAQPSAWLAELPPATRAGLKPLALDPARPESRRALQSFLPATLREPLGPRAASGAGTRTLAVMSFLVASEAGPAAASAPAADALIPLAQGLCRELPALRRDGHPKWREVQPALELPVGWPYDSAAQQALRSCPVSP